MKPALCLVALVLGCPFARAAVLHAITDELPATAPAQISTTTQTVRGGTAAFRHVTRAGGDAAEFVIPADGAGAERWYGWSMQLPADFERRGRSTLVMQLVETSPVKPSPTQCPVPTSSLEINAKGQLVFHLHVPAERGAEPKCRAFILAPDITPARGQWFDFVLHAKWTSGTDGFVELWVKRHDNNFFQMVDYHGPTCVSSERGPTFRIGAQVTAREETPARTDVTVFTDELRVGDAGSSFDEVAPAGAATRAAEAQRGQIHYLLYPSALNHQKIAVMVYTPPGYAISAKRYPVVYNLHGAGGGSPERQWTRVRATLTNAMDSGTVPPTIYVFVNALGDTGYIDYPDGRGPKIFSSIVTELIPFIDANYRTIADRRGRGIDGFSMGGGGALMLALKRPDLFSAVVAYGGNFIPYNPDDTNVLRRKLSAEFSQYALVERRTDEIRANLRIRLVCGDQDQHHAENLKFKAFLEGLKIPVSWVSVPGVGHETRALFDHVGIESLKFMQLLNAAPPLSKADAPKVHEEVAADPNTFDRYVGVYLLAPATAMTMTREGDQLYTQLTGQQKFPVFPEGEGKFLLKVVDARLSFTADAEGRVTQVTLHQNGQDWVAKRADAAQAAQIAAAQDATAKRIKEQTPAAGSESALRRHLDELRAGQPNYDLLSPALAKATRRQLVHIKETMAPLGAVQSITFKGVGPAGDDIFEVQFERGATEWRITMESEQKIAGLNFRPL